MFNIYTNVKVMKNGEELASTTAGHNDDVIAIAKELIEDYKLENVTHIEIEMVLEKGENIYYKDNKIVSKVLRISWCGSCQGSVHDDRSRNRGIVKEEKRR